MKINELTFGDIVCAETNGIQTPPMKIFGLWEDDSVYMEIDPEQGDPFEFDITEIRGVKITKSLLDKLFEHYGEEEDMWTYTSSNKDDIIIIEEDGYFLFVLNNIRDEELCFLPKIHYIHELQHYLTLSKVDKKIELKDLY